MVCQHEVLLPGFICSVEGRRPDPVKVEQLSKWAEYKSEKDIASDLAFANFLHEFLGPDFSDRTKPLRLYLKKGAEFKNFAQDKATQTARRWLIDQVLDHCVLVVLDWMAASKPWSSGRPLELFIDASDERWCGARGQRANVGGTPLLISLCSITGLKRRSP